MVEPRSSNVFFNPDEHPEDTLKAFEEFIKVFVLRYNAQYPDPPKVSIEAAINRWKITNTTEETPNPTPTVAQYDTICNEWKSKDKVAKILGMFSSQKLYDDWCVAEPTEATRNSVMWDDFVAKMKAYYKPTENMTLKHYLFQGLSQEADETFARFCNRIEAEAKHCDFKCSPHCTVDKKIIRNQILYGTSNDKIREEAIKRSWDLENLRKEGMQMESAARGSAMISGETAAVNKLGNYAYSKLKQNMDKNTNNGVQKQSNTNKKQKTYNCYNCGEKVSGSIYKHKENCAAVHHICGNCNKQGHFESVCKRKCSNVNAVKDEEDEENVAVINLFRIKTSINKAKPHLKATNTKKDFKVQVSVNNRIDTVVAHVRDLNFNTFNCAPQEK